MTSPWELALRGRLRSLDPALADCFSTIPSGSAGRGSGERVMRHEIRMTPRGLVDVLGARGRLELRSIGVRLRLVGRIDEYAGSLAYRIEAA